MLETIKKVPVPAAGVALGLAALGNLLHDSSDLLYGLCGLLSLFMASLVVAKVALFPAMVREDFKNPLIASVSATFMMTIMQLATYIAPFAFELGFVLWMVGVGAHLTLMVWFSLTHLAHLKLEKVFPTYFICYVGIIVAAVTSPVFGMEVVGSMLFWLGFACYPILLVLVTVRYVKCPVPEASRPLFCIYSAPASLSIVGYIAITPNPNLLFVLGMLILGQAFLVMVALRLPKFLKLAFYPSFAAMTFPFVITATALILSLDLFALAGVAIAPALVMLAIFEVALAVCMVGYVFIRYMIFLFAKPQAKAAPTLETAASKR